MVNELNLKGLWVKRRGQEDTLDSDQQTTSKETEVQRNGKVDEEWEALEVGSLGLNGSRDLSVLQSLI